MKLFHRLFLLGVVSLVAMQLARGQVNIPTWQHDLQHSGNNAPGDGVLTPGNVSSPGNFGLLFSQPMDGQTYGQPLLASGDHCQRHGPQHRLRGHRTRVHLRVRR